MSSSNLCSNLSPYRFGLSGSHNYHFNLLVILDDNQDIGSLRIRDVLSMVDSIEEVDTLLVPMLHNILNSKTGRSLYQELRNRVLMTIFQALAILESLVTMGVVNMASLSASRTICSFLLALAKTFLEGQKYLALISLAT